MKNKGITLIALVITIIVLLILAGVTIATLTGEDGILKKASTAKEENQEKTATEIINLKITNTQLQSYKEEEKMPDLQYLADRLYEDNEIQYIYNESQKNASTKKEKIIVTGNTVFTKLSDYPYEFEINSNLQLASINGIKISNNDKNTISLTPEELNRLVDDAIEEKTKVVTMPKDNITFNTEYVNDSAANTWVSGKRYGKLMVLNFALAIKKDIPNASINLISGLPEPEMSSAFVGFDGNGSRAILYWFSGTNINANYTGEIKYTGGNHVLYGSLTYIVKEEKEV